MVTTDVFYEVWSDIVGRCKKPLAFTNETNKILDEDDSLNYPLCGFVLPTTFQTQAAEILQDHFKLELMFVDQTAKDRDPVEQMRSHSRMNAIGRQCVQQFLNAYIQKQGSWQGQPLDLKLIGQVVYEPIWDDGTMMRTGVGVTMIVKDVSQVECLEDYFD